MIKLKRVYEEPERPAVPFLDKALAARPNETRIGSRPLAERERLASAAFLGIP